MGKSKKMTISTPVLAHVFKALEKADMAALSQCNEEEIRPILPCLVRMSLIAPIENTAESVAARKSILKILSGIETVNSMVALLSIDFTSLEAESKKEQQLRLKAGGLAGGPQDNSFLVQNLINGLPLEFECSEPLKRLRLLLSEIIYVMAQLKEPRTSPDWYHKECELFDNQCYFEEVADILSIGVSELPVLLSPVELAEILLHFSNAPQFIARIVANQPDSFREVLGSLISNGEAQDEECPGGLVRMKTVRTLCLMNPSAALNARNLCVENCRMPALAIYLTLDAAKSSLALPTHQHLIKLPKSLTTSGDAGEDGGSFSVVCDVVSFVTGLLLSPEQQQRTWFSHYVKIAQKRKWEHMSGLSALRTELSERLFALLRYRTSHMLPASQVISATALLRLYTALKNLCGLKLHEEREVSPLLQLLTCQPPLSAAGVRFVSTGLCVLIACPQLLSTPENERRAADWIGWLVKEEVHFSGALGVWSSSFGALLLLVAIHFHVGQLSAIMELVSTALGMRLMVKSPNLNKIRHIVTHEVFTESVVTMIATKVSVTRGLNATLPGFLPVHCVYHLLKSRMFTRHRVNIKNWIYKQVCSSHSPMHPVLPCLIEVFVRSVLGAGNVSDSATNDPITESEILTVFKLSSFNNERQKTLCSTLKDRRSVLRPRLRNTEAHCMMFKRPNRDASSVCFSPQESCGRSPDLLSPDSKTDEPLTVECVLTSQLLLLYYLLLYEDLRLSTGLLQPQAPGSLPKPKQHYTYSANLFSQLPIRYLLSRAQKDQANYGGLFSALLKLLAHHYPQLCLVEDWLYRAPQSPPAILPPRIPLTSQTLAKALAESVKSPGVAVVLLERCMTLPCSVLWSVAASPLTAGLVHLLNDDVPRTVLDKYVLVWRRLNSIYPRRLWAMTIEGLRAPPAGVHLLSRRPLCEDDLVMDPLYALRVHHKVFRRAPLLQLVEYILRVYLLSSRTFLSQHQQSTAAALCAGPVFEEERDKLRAALLLTQESAAVQILLESIIEEHDSMDDTAHAAGRLLTLQEVQSVVFSYLHQAFIKDTTLAKLVHFQGYPRSLVDAVVQGVPSMHIAVGLNWIPELLQQPIAQQRPRQHHSLEQLLFTVQLTVSLAKQNAMPSTLSIARLCLSVLSTLISVLNYEGRLTLVKGGISSVVSLGRVFPCLLPELVQLLVTCGRLVRAHSSVLPAPSALLTGVQDQDASNSDDIGGKVESYVEMMETDEPKHVTELDENAPVGSGEVVSLLTVEDEIIQEITRAFRALVKESVMAFDLY